MKRFAFVLAIGLAAVLAIPNLGSAQVPGPADPTKPVTGMKPDRTTADAATRKQMLERQAVLRKKRAECRAEARAKKIPLRQRAAWLKECRAR